MQTPSKIRGVTLIELMIVIVITAILLAWAIPSFQETIDRNRLKAATETLYGDFQFAKSEAIKRNEQIRVIFDNSTTTEVINGKSVTVTWCYGVTEQASCGCRPSKYSTPNRCTIDGIPKDSLSVDYPDITITPSANFSFGYVRGTVNAGNVTLNSARSKQTQVILNGLGRIRICSPTGSSNVTGYAACS